jgi:hypothetical protein
LPTEVIRREYQSLNCACFESARWLKQTAPARGLRPKLREEGRWVIRRSRHSFLESKSGLIWKAEWPNWSIRISDSLSRVPDSNARRGGWFSQCGYSKEGFSWFAKSPQVGRNKPRPLRSKQKGSLARNAKRSSGKRVRWRQQFISISGYHRRAFSRPSRFLNAGSMPP